VLRAFAEAEDALVAVRFAAEQRTSRDSQVVHARGALQAAERRYQSGGAPFLEVRDAQRDLLATELAAVAAREQQVIALVRLYEALGGSWESEPAGAGPR
jgi:multidrug efflux system outer membrane protein